MTKWYACFRCQTIKSYAVDEETGETTLSRGEYLVCGQKYDAMVTGFASKQEAEQCLQQDPYHMKQKTHATKGQP